MGRGPGKNAENKCVRGGQKHTWNKGAVSTFHMKLKGVICKFSYKSEPHILQVKKLQPGK